MAYPSEHSLRSGFILSEDGKEALVDNQSSMGDTIQRSKDVLGLDLGVKRRESGVLRVDAEITERIIKMYNDLRMNK